MDSAKNNTMNWIPGFVRFVFVVGLTLCAPVWTMTMLAAMFGDWSAFTATIVLSGVIVMVISYAGLLTILINREEVGLSLKRSGEQEGKESEAHLSKTYLIVPDQHAHYEHSNERADWLANLTIDLKPDVVVNMGDAADMPSLSSYDKGKRSFQGKSYKADILAHLDFQERWWGPVKATKKRMPKRVILEGNHENRVERALDLSPELAGTIGFHDYAFGDYYHDIVRYDGQLPGIYESDGILFAHFFPTGISGRPMGGVSPARMMAAKNKTSCIAAHTHTLDYMSERNISDKTINCLITGCYQDYVNDWAGPIGKFWQAGVSVLRNVENGNFDFQWIGLESLKRAYGTNKEVEISVEEV